MVVACPKCKTRLNVPDEKIKSEGSRFKCPKCAAVLLVKRPAGGRPLDRKKVLVAHANPVVVERVKAALQKAPFQYTVAADGVDVLVRALKELPFIFIVDIGLPGIDGFEIARRLRAKDEIKGARVILVSATGDPERLPREPASAHGVDAYVDAGKIETDLAPTLRDILSGRKREPESQAPGPSPAPASASTPPPVTAPPGEEEDREVSRAKRLARIVLSDIELYSPEKVLDAIRADSFQSVFANELKEGLKHYEKRIPQEVRNKGNFFQEAIDEFVQKKKRALG